MFKPLTEFCRSIGRARGLSISTLCYMERIDSLNGAVVSEILEDERDRGNITKMMRAHPEWFVYSSPKISGDVGRPGRKIYLSPQGKTILKNARKAYLKGAKE